MPPLRLVRDKSPAIGGAKEIARDACDVLDGLSSAKELRRPPTIQEMHRKNRGANLKTSSKTRRS